MHLLPPSASQIYVGVEISALEADPFVFVGSYVAPAGAYTLYVQHKNKQAVPGSPFTVQVVPGIRTLSLRPSLPAPLFSCLSVQPLSLAHNTSTGPNDIDISKLPTCGLDSIRSLNPGYWNDSWWQPLSCSYKRFTVESACSLLRRKSFREIILSGDSHTRLLLNGFVQFLTGSESGDERIFDLLIPSTPPGVLRVCFILLVVDVVFLRILPPHSFTGRRIPRNLPRSKGVRERGPLFPLDED